MKPDNQDDDAATDALTLLTAEHDKLKALFEQFESIKDQDDANPLKAKLVEQLCDALTLHSTIEEEIFYPALRAAIDDDLIDEADTEHAGVRELIGQLEIMAAGEDLFDATVAMLGEEVAQHIAYEEGDMYEAVRRASIDLDALGAQLAMRRAQIAQALSPPTRIDALAPHAGTRRQPRPPN